MKRPEPMLPTSVDPDLPSAQATAEGKSPSGDSETPEVSPMNIATISAGFEKGDFLVREEQGNRVYFDFFEEAFNYIANKGYCRMQREQEKEWIELMNVIHDSVKGGMKYNTGTLLMVLSRNVQPKDPEPKPIEKSTMKAGRTPSKDPRPTT